MKTDALKSEPNMENAAGLLAAETEGAEVKGRARVESESESEERKRRPESA